MMMRTLVLLRVSNNCWKDSDMATYKCPLCGAKITVGVRLTVPPTCNNPKHKTNPKIMEVTTK